jgi:hypothetical protein
MRQVAQLFLNTLSVSGAVGNLGYRLLHREAALDLLEEAAEAVFEAYFGQGGGARPVREGRACIFLRLLGPVHPAANTKVSGDLEANVVRDISDSVGTRAIHPPRRLFAAEQQVGSSETSRPRARSF